MYKSIIFIKFVSRSKKLKPKLLSCVWSRCSVDTLTFCWCHRLQFLDQLERKDCKGLQNLWPFCNRAPKGPFWQGLSLYWSTVPQHLMIGRRIKSWRQRTLSIIIINYKLFLIFLALLAPLVREGDKWWERICDKWSTVDKQRVTCILIFKYEEQWMTL